MILNSNHSARRPLVYSCAVLGAVAAVLAGADYASAAMVDPSAFGIAASGPHPLSARPAVDWTAGPPVAAGSGPISVGPVRFAAAAVDAGNGFATSRVLDLQIDGVSVPSVAATCHDGVTGLVVSGAQLRRGQVLHLPGGAVATVGLTTTYSDKSVSITALTITLPTPAGPETITVGQARCGA